MHDPGKRSTNTADLFQRGGGSSRVPLEHCKRDKPSLSALMHLNYTCINPFPAPLCFLSFSLSFPSVCCVELMGPRQPTPPCSTHDSSWSTATTGTHSTARHRTAQPAVHQPLHVCITIPAQEPRQLRYTSCQREGCVCPTAAIAACITVRKAQPHLLNTVTLSPHDAV